MEQRVRPHPAVWLDSGNSTDEAEAYDPEEPHAAPSWLQSFFLRLELGWDMWAFDSAVAAYKR